jgi:hypothetical protein
VGHWNLTEKIVKIVGVMLSLGLCFGTFGCSMETGSVDGELAEGEETIGAVSEGIFQAGCATLPADRTIDAGATPQWSENGMPQVRPGCIGSRIVDVNNYQEGPDVGVNGVTFAWGEPAPITIGECQKTWMGTSVYRKVGSTYEHVKDTEQYGIWHHICPNGPSGACATWCEQPYVTYSSSVSDNNSYRFVGSTRRISTSPNGDPSGNYTLKKVTIRARVTE